MKIAIGCDHGGVNLKNKIKEYLDGKGVAYEDFGTMSTTQAVDYPDIGGIVAKAVANGEFNRGILICGTGIGISIAANKVKGIRAALCHDVFSACATREHNDSNILCMGERVIGFGLAAMIVEVWLQTDFAGGRHAIRVKKLEELETTQV